MFQILPLPYAPFAHLFALTDDDLAARRARRVVADGFPGFPCRVSLEDAQPGETLVLVHHTHQSAESPYHASHAVYVRAGANEACPAPGEVPPVLLRRPISLRAFDAAGMMRAADLAEGEAVGPAIECLLAISEAAEVHLHNAKPGCYAARVVRA